MGNAYPGLVVGGVSAAPKELVKQAADWHDAMGAGKTFRQKTNDRRKGLKLVCTRQHKHRTLKCAALLVAKWRAADPEARGGERLRRHLETTKVVGHSCVGAQPKRCRVRRNVKTTVQLAEGVQGVLDRAPRMEVSSVAAVGAEEQGLEKDEQIAYHIAFRMKQAARKNIYGTKAQQFAEFVGV